ncbi:hypothetical protein PanWU01x14_164590, partial [Parasponia andersonii]
MKRIQFITKLVKSTVGHEFLLLHARPAPIQVTHRLVARNLVYQTQTQTQTRKHVALADGAGTSVL